VYCVEEFLSPGNNFDESSLWHVHVTNASTIKGNPIKDLIVSGFDSSEGKDQMGYYTPLHECGRRPRQHLGVMHVQVAAATLIWERESDGQSPVCKIMSVLSSRGKMT
jgi:hypothetical protein